MVCVKSKHGCVIVFVLFIYYLPIYIHSTSVIFSGDALGYVLAKIVIRYYIALLMSTMEVTDCRKQ